MTTPERDEPPTCACPFTDLRRRLQANGVEIVVRQCRVCGRNKGAVRKDGVPDVAGLLPWNQRLYDDWTERMNAYYAGRRLERERLDDAADDEWWRRYDQHMASAKWFALRERVFARCGGLCEGCRLRPATHVHHLTYERMGDEMLFDLVAVCKACHDRIHGRDTSPPGYRVRFSRD